MTQCAASLQPLVTVPPAWPCNSQEGNLADPYYGSEMHLRLWFLAGFTRPTLGGNTKPGKAARRLRIGAKYERIGASDRFGAGETALK